MNPYTLESHPWACAGLLDRHGRLVRYLVLLAIAALCAGCAGVKVRTVTAKDYVSERRGDVLTTGKLSTSARDVLTSLAVQPDRCQQSVDPCVQALTHTDGIDAERQLATLAELWLQEALRQEKSGAEAQPRFEDALGAYLQVARYGYAYLFFTSRRSGERAFEDRQTQMRDYYNFAVQQATALFFEQYRSRPDQVRGRMQVGDWLLSANLSDLYPRELTPRRASELLPASRLTFQGIRSIYRRDGLGADLVIATDADARGIGEKPTAPLTGSYSEMPYRPVTAIIAFSGSTLEEVLHTREATLLGYDPYQHETLDVHDIPVPLAANFTSAYGLWLARSDFSTQALRNVLGKSGSLDAPYVYLTQPFDPNRQVIVMLHGLASSPEAWINVANEVMGDEALRKRYQVWQVYYPTNAPLAYNHASIRAALAATFQHFDPEGTAASSRDIVIIGHSMGGVLGRLLVSSSGSVLLDAVKELRQIDDAQVKKLRAETDGFLTFEAYPGISRAIFIAAPHKGTPFASNRLSRILSGLITMPVKAVDHVMRLNRQIVGGSQASSARLPASLPNGVDSLKDSNPFIRAAAELPISPSVRYHSIVANHTPRTTLEDSDDGLVPYRSAHLPGAESELVIPYSHSVQETPEAILEIRRILREQR